MMFSYWGLIVQKVEAICPENGGYLSGAICPGIFVRGAKCPDTGESLLGDYKEGHTGGSLAQFTSLKNRGSWFTDIKNSFSWITKIRKLDTL